MIRCGILLMGAIVSVFIKVSFDVRADLPPELRIYTYDSFVAPEGLGPVIFPIFEKRYHCKIKALALEDGGQVVSRLELDAKRGKPNAHVVVGIDQPFWEKAKSSIEMWNRWMPNDFAKIPMHLRVDDGFLPYDYGPLALIVDQQSLRNVSVKSKLRLKDLLRPEWKRNIILEDPRTSTPGLSFLLFTQKVLGLSVWDFWKKFQNQWLTLTPGWDKAYQLFLRKEAPLVWSYVTSQAYHEESGESGPSSRRYQAILFEEGQPVQIEGAALVKGSFKSEKERLLAKKFLEFLISAEVQELLPKKTWMLPVRQGISLPNSFKHLPQPTRLLPLSVSLSEIEAALDQWRKSIQ